ncbi:MAG TPA: alpha/beta hydrolase [Casimicrobium huifangae]|jgi:alpha/beta superfamily hydrolase|uniref:alpha/beta hydrolase n=1 Tax=Casimicrobium huifangae TaxID=2591109 RepID=UPI002B71B239|nr:alpha/beta hydrolase [Casimicrobium huifangae]HQA34107.1 alpha/beta hydrolase [Casimicrobium huifangae]HQD64883.1 alpha/beta hydrolase [Casimicrobium huifangae]
MSTAIQTLIDGPAGPLEIAFQQPATAATALALICHPHPVHGGTMDNKVVQTLAKAFLELGYATMRFNFRGVGKSAGSFDEGIGETEDAAAALAWARAQVSPSLPLIAAGFSFGCFVQSRLLPRSQPQQLVLVGPAVSRFQLAEVPKDTLVVHGEEDDVVPLDAVMTWARPQGLPVTVFPGTGHFFHGRLTELKAVVKRNCRL